MVKAEAVAAKATKPKRKAKADLYVKVMRRMASEGDPSFPSREAARARKLLDQGMTEEKRKDLGERINIYRSLTDQAKKTKPEEGGGDGKQP